MYTGLSTIKESAYSINYGSCQDKFVNSSFLSSPTKSEIMMFPKIHKLVDQSNELSKNEIEMINALRNSLVESVRQLITSLKSQIAEIQSMRCHRLKKVLNFMQNLFYIGQSDETELQEFATELQYFVNEINIELECLSRKTHL
nr:uncharacterized protein LOC121118862 [Lepeophtheirus salmonis]